MLFATCSRVSESMFTPDKGHGEDRRFRDGLVCRRLCLTSIARCRMKLLPHPPTASTPPTFSWPTTFSRDADSALDVTRSLSEPPAEFQSCLYACLIGHKQHAWLCSRGNGKTLERAEQPGISPRAPTLSVTPSSHFVSFFCAPSCFLVMCGPGHVYCHSSANHSPPCMAGQTL